MVKYDKYAELVYINKNNINNAKQYFTLLKNSYSNSFDEISEKFKDEKHARELEKEKHKVEILEYRLKLMELGNKN